MIAPKCDVCYNELVEFGGILLSPPNKENKVDKFHLCVSCYNLLIEDFLVLDKKNNVR